MPYGSMLLQDAVRADLCRIMHPNFRERSFHALG